MIDPSSRYAGTETANIDLGTGDERRSIRYLRRRFIREPQGAITLVRHPVSQGERIDNLAAFYFTDPTQFWRICDANGVLHPDELVATVGRSLSIVLPLR